MIMKEFTREYWLVIAALAVASSMTFAFWLQSTGAGS